MSQTLYTNTGALRMVATRQYDNLNRLTNLVWTAGGNDIASFSYQYNNANQRTRVTLVDGSYWLFGYDTLGQVTSGKRYWADGSHAAGQQFEYTFDDIGNRKASASGGDSTGASLRGANYTNNSLNQLTSRDVPGYLHILGSADANATVTLSSTAGRYSTPAGSFSPTVRHGQYFAGELMPNNSTGAVWLAITNLAVRQDGTNADIASTNIGSVFVAQTPEFFGYDADGNLTNDGRWAVIWDAEERPVSFATRTAVEAVRVIRCVYDHQGRRIQKTVETEGPLHNVTRFVYDNWNVVGILDESDQLRYSFTWGLDLSGTMQGAGGVGGLISMKVHNGSLAGTYFYVYDGNGNVAALVKAADGSVAAQYEYGPFGELLRATGQMARANPFRFSTKYQDEETDLLYYGYRYYNASTGYFLSRDLDEGSENAYSLVENDPVGDFDVLGLYKFVEKWHDADMSAISSGDGQTAFTGPTVDERLELKWSPGKCKCSVRKPQTYVLRVDVYIPKVGTSRGGAWVTGKFRGQSKSHEVKHVKVWKHYGALWEQFESWQKRQTETGPQEQPCLEKLTRKIQECQGLVEQAFWSGALEAQGGHTAETFTTETGWVPSSWLGRMGGLWRTQAPVFVMTGQWKLNLKKISFPCK